MSTGNPVVGIDIVARLDAFRAEMQKVAPITEKQAREMTSALAKEIRASEAAAKKATAAVSKAAKDSETTWKGAAKGIKDALGGIGYGDLAEKTGKLTDAFTALVSPEGLVAAGALAAGAAFVALAAANVAAGAGLVSFGLHAKQAQKDLEGFRLIGSDVYPVVPAETQASIDALAASGDALAAEWNHVSVVIGANVAPGLERMADLIVGAAVEAGHLVDAWSATGSALEAFGRFVATEAAFIFEPLTTGAYATAKAYVALSDVVGHQVSPELREAVSSLTAFHTEIGNTGSALAGSAADSLYNRFKTVADEGHDLIATTERANQALKDHKDAAKGAAAADKEAAEAAKALGEQLTAAFDAIRSAEERSAAVHDRWTDAQLSAIEKIAKARDADLVEYTQQARAAGATDEEVAAGRVDIEASAQEQIKAIQDKARADAEKAAADSTAKQAAAQMAVVDKLAGYASQATSALSAGFEASYEAAANAAQALQEQLSANSAHYTEAQRAELRKRIAAEREAAEKAYRANQAAQAASALINTASAITQALSASPPPFNFIDAALVGAAGAIEIGKIESTQPAFHSGYAPDEMAGPPSKMLKREGAGILTPQGITAMGGPAAVRAANAGAAPSPGGQIVAVTVYKNDRQMQKVKYDAIRAGDPYTELMARNSRPWRRA